MTALLEARDIRVQFGGLNALSDINFTLDEASLACIIGPNGAGKSTFLNVLTGTQRPTKGTVLFRGRTISGLPLHRIARAGIARKFQIPSVFQSMTVADNLVVAYRGADASPDGDVIDLIGLSAKRNIKAGELPHGEKQWLEIGMAIAARPSLLLLDEPTAGMTPQETQATAALIHRLKARLAIIAVEHDISFVRALDADTVVLHQGRFFRRGSFREIEADETVREVYLGKR